MNYSRKYLLFLILIILTLSIFVSQFANAHCQIPCGIYDDYARVQAMFEDALTVEKSIKLIGDLSEKTDTQSKNQLVRWVMNKEKHAQNVISAISNYFLTQRVKPDQKDYVDRLKKHHAVIIAAMKVKQNSDMKYAIALRESLDSLATFYQKHDH